MSRIVQIDGVGKQRTFLTRSILQAIQELMRQQEINLKTKDLAAYIVLALQEVHETIESTVAAWEKRDYWLKADRFRMEWEWTGSLSDQLERAVLSDEWEKVPGIAVRVANKLQSVKLPKRLPKIQYWNGAWSRLISHSRPKR